MPSARRATMRTEEDVEVGRTHVGAGPGPASIGTSVARRLDLGKPTRARHARWTFGDANVSPESMLIATAAVWGSYHPTMRLMLTSEDGWETPTPAELNVSRSAITAAMCVAQHLVMRRLSREKNTPTRDGRPDDDDDDDDEDRERDRYPNARTPLRGEGRRGRRLVATNGGGDAEGRGSDSEGGGSRRARTTPPTTRAPAAAARSRERSTKRRLLAASAELAALHALTVGLQSCGVDHSSATRASFLATTSTVVVPLLATATGTPVAKRTWASAAACVLGTALIVSSRTPGSSDYSAALDEDAKDADTTLGDGLILAGAVVWATFLLRISKHARTLPVAPLVIWRNVLMFACYACWWAFDERFFRGGSEHMGFRRGRFSRGRTGSVPIAREAFPWRDNSTTWGRVVFLAVGPGFACSWLQTIAQAKVAAAEAQVLISTQALWGAAWAFAMMGERMAPMGWAGGFAIVAGAVMVADGGRRGRRDKRAAPRGNKSS